MGRRWLLCVFLVVGAATTDAAPATAHIHGEGWANIPWPYQSTVIEDAKPWYYSVIGKLYLTTTTGQDAWCSAAVVPAQNKSLLITSGHCLNNRSRPINYGTGDQAYDAGTWNENFLFVPAYSNGAQPYGRYPYLSVTVTRSWYLYKNLHHDVGVIVVDVNPGTGRYISDTVGSLGLIFNASHQGVINEWYAFGYSGNLDGGRYLRSCHSYTAMHEPAPAPPAGGDDHSIYGIGCNLQNGVSGGPMVYKRQSVDGCEEFPAECSLIKSVGSYGIDPDAYGPSLMGPHLGDQEFSIYFSQSRVQV